MLICWALRYEHASLGPRDEASSVYARVWLCVCVCVCVCVCMYVMFLWVSCVQVNCNKFHTIEWFLSAFEINVINEVAYFMAQRRLGRLAPWGGQRRVEPYKMKRF